MARRRKRRVTFLPAAAGGSGFPAPSIWYAPDASFDGCVVAAYQAIGVPGYAQSLWNLANIGTYDLSPGIAPGWSPIHGWQFNASLGTYLRTGVVPLESYSYIVRFTNHDITDVNSVFGMYGLADGAQIDLWASMGAGSMVWWIANDTDNYRPPIIDHGVFGLAAKQPYRNSLPDGAVIADAWTAPGIELYLGAVNNNGAPEWQDTVNIQAFAIYSCTLDATQMAAAMDAAAML